MPKNIDFEKGQMWKKKSHRENIILCKFHCSQPTHYGFYGKMVVHNSNLTTIGGIFVGI